MKTVKSVYFENVVNPTIELGECHCCEEDNAVEYYQEEVPRGYCGKCIVTLVEKNHRGMNSNDQYE